MSNTKQVIDAAEPIQLTSYIICDTLAAVPSEDLWNAACATIQGRRPPLIS